MGAPSQLKLYLMINQNKLPLITATVTDIFFTHEHTENFVMKKKYISEQYRLKKKKKCNNARNIEL